MVDCRADHALEAKFLKKQKPAIYTIYLKNNE